MIFPAWGISPARPAVSRARLRPLVQHPWRAAGGRIGITAHVRGPRSRNGARRAASCGRWLGSYARLAGHLKWPQRTGLRGNIAVARAPRCSLGNRSRLNRNRRNAYRWARPKCAPLMEALMKAIHWIIAAAAFVFAEPVQAGINDPESSEEGRVGKGRSKRGQQ